MTCMVSLPRIRSLELGPAHQNLDFQATQTSYMFPSIAQGMVPATLTRCSQMMATSTRTGRLPRRTRIRWCVAARTA